MLILIANFWGCTPYPRYRSGGPLEQEEARPSVQEEISGEQASLGTERLLELGRIIQSYLGTPYKGMGESGAGMDCSKFTEEVFYRFGGMELPRTAAEQFELGAEVPKGRMSYGDLVFFSGDGDSISHVGIYIGYGEFIHSTNTSGVIISSLDDKYWKSRFAGARNILP